MHSNLNRLGERLPWGIYFTPSKGLSSSSNLEALAKNIMPSR